MGKFANRRAIALGAALMLGLLVGVLLTQAVRGENLADAAGTRLALLDLANLKPRALQELRIADIKDRGLRDLGLRDLKDPKLRKIPLSDLREQYLDRVPLTLLRDDALAKLTTNDVQNAKWLFTPPPLVIPGNKVASAMSSTEQAAPYRHDIAERNTDKKADEKIASLPAGPLAIKNLPRPADTQRKQTTSARVIAKRPAAKKRTVAAKPRYRTRAQAVASANPSPRAITRPTPAPRRHIAVERNRAFPTYAAPTNYRSYSAKEFSRIYKREYKEGKKRYKERIKRFLKEIF